MFVFVAHISKLCADDGHKQVDDQHVECQQHHDEESRGATLARLHQLIAKNAPTNDKRTMDGVSIQNRGLRVIAAKKERERDEGKKQRETKGRTDRVM